MGVLLSGNETVHLSAHSGDILICLSDVSFQQLRSFLLLNDEPERKEVTEDYFFYYSCFHDFEKV